MDQTFVLRQEGFHPESAAREESLFSLGNGFLGWRGNYEEGYGQFRGGVEGCYLNGFYETEKIRYGEIAYGYAEESQTMLNITSSQRVLLEAEGTALHPDGAESTCRVLEMERGLLRRETVYALPGGGKLRVRVARLVSFAHSHGAAISFTVTAEGAPCRVALTPLVDGDVTNLVCTDDPRVGSGLHGRVLSLPRMGQAGDALGMVQHTGNTRLAVACAMVNRLDRPAEITLTQTETCQAQRFAFTLADGESATLCKYVAYFRGGVQEEETLLAQALADRKAWEEWETWQRPRPWRKRVLPPWKASRRRTCAPSGSAAGCGWRATTRCSRACALTSTTCCKARAGTGKPTLPPRA